MCIYNEPRSQVKNTINFLPIDETALQPTQYIVIIKVVDIHCIYLSKSLQIVMVILHSGPTADRQTSLVSFTVQTLSHVEKR